jgi:hypothetical protein
MDQRIEAFLADVLALAGEEPDAVQEGARVALAKCEAIFRLQEPNKRMRDRAAHACRGLCRAHAGGRQSQRHLKMVAQDDAGMRVHVMYLMTYRTSHRVIDVAVFRGIFGNKALNAVSGVGAPVYKERHARIAQRRGAGGRSRRTEAVSLASAYSACGRMWRQRRHL